MVVTDQNLLNCSGPVTSCGAKVAASNGSSATVAAHTFTGPFDKTGPSANKLLDRDCERSGYAK